MKEYIGTKIVQAEPALRFQLLSGEMRIVPYDQIHESGPVDAVSVEDGYKVVYQDGYQSWSPKDVFEAAYHETDCGNKIYGILIQVTKITGAEVEELREIARGQREYTHPLKMATTKKQNDLGKHNDAVLDALLNLKTVIESGAHLAE